MRKPQPCTVDGVDYPSLYALAKAFGVSTYRARIYQKAGTAKGWVDHRCRPVTCGGVVYTSVDAAAKALGVHAATAYTRLRLNTPLDKPYNRRMTRGGVIFEGVWYPTLKAFAGALGLPPAKAKILLDEEGKNDA